jgi:hypothetical protein
VPALVQHFEGIAPPQLEGLMGSRVAAGVDVASRPAVEAGVRAERLCALQGDPPAHEPSADSRSRPWAEAWEGAPSIARTAVRDCMFGPLSTAAAREDAYAGASGSAVVPLYAAPHRGELEEPGSRSGLTEALQGSRRLSVESNWQASDHVAAAASRIFPPRARPAAAFISAAAADADAVDPTVSARAGFTRKIQPQNTGAAYQSHAPTADAQPPAGYVSPEMVRSMSAAADSLDRQRGEKVVRFSSEVDSGFSRARTAPTGEIRPFAADAVSLDSAESRIHESDRAQLECAQRLRSTPEQPPTSQASEHMFDTRHA